LQVIRWSINTTSENVGLVCECEIINTKTDNKQRHYFLRGNPNRKNDGEW